MSKLFSKEAVFVTDAATKEDVFKEVSDVLTASGDVKDDFYDHLLDREKNYPTALDITHVSADYPYIAVPHTEPEFVNNTKIVPIKLTNPVTFQNMSSPHKDLPVEFLFLILNADKASQVHLLSDLIVFIEAQDKEDLKQFFNTTDKEEIYNYLNTHFK